jgi:hypothetical protein
MNVLLKVAGWTLRASAAICITFIIVSVLQGKITELPQLLESVAYHAVFAVSGAQLVGLAKRREGRVVVAPQV